jgi:hypothetical protein
MLMHGTCVICNNEAVKNMGEVISIQARCPKCRNEVGIITFDGDPTEPLKGCSICGYSEQLDVIEMRCGRENIR